MNATEGEIKAVWMPDHRNCAAWAHLKPDGTVRTVVGNDVALLALDGHRVPTDAIGYDEATREFRRLSGKIVDYVLSGAPVDLGADTVAGLRALAGPQFAPGPDVEGECEECDGTGEVVCYACDREHDCDECDGTGRVWRGPEGPAVRILHVGGLMFDARNLAQLLPMAPDGPVRVSLLGRKLILSGAGWALVAMALTDKPVEICEEATWAAA